MTWQLDRGTNTFTSTKPDVDHSPIDVTIDSFNPDRPHVTVVFGDPCIVTCLDELDDTAGQCGVTITSPHAELLLILPTHLATFLTGIEAAHREMLEQPPVSMVTPPLRTADDITRMAMMQILTASRPADKVTLKVVRDGE